MPYANITLQSITNINESLCLDLSDLPQEGIAASTGKNEKSIIAVYETGRNITFCVFPNKEAQLEYEKTFLDSHGIFEILWEYIND